MRRFFLSACALAAYASAASAADLPTQMPPPVFVPPPLPVFTWTGFYGGVQGGYSWDGTEIYTTTWSHGINRDGPYGGGVLGYNYQFGDFIVAGIQGEYNISDIKGSVTPLPTYSLTTRINSFGSVDGRFGLTFNRFLAYAIGGVAFGDINHTISLTGLEFDSFNAYEVGYDVGGGLEYAFTNNLSARVEYRSYDFGHHSFASVGLLGPHYTKETLSTARLGLVYLFGGPVLPPVVARY